MQIKQLEHTTLDAIARLELNVVQHYAQQISVSLTAVVQVDCLRDAIAHKQVTVFLDIVLPPTHVNLHAMLINLLEPHTMMGVTVRL